MHASVCQRYFRAALLQICFFLGGVVRNHQAHRPAQPEVVKVIFQEVVIRSAINRLFREALVFHAAEYQNRNVRSGGTQPFEGGDTHPCRLAFRCLR